MAASSRAETERITDQLQRACEGAAWHGPSLFELLADVTAGRAAARPIPEAHSIWEIVLHVAAWQDAVRERLGGAALELTPEEDWPPVTDASEAAWRAAVDALRESYQALRAAVAGLTDARLEESVPGKPYSVYFLLHGVIQHALYHAGQIAVLKKPAPLPKR